jgi:cell division protein FtsB
MIAIRLNRFELLVLCGCLCLLGFFAWHAWAGPRGYPYLDRLAAKVQKLELERDETKHSRVVLETKVGLLRPESTDPDLVDELARQTLNVATANEIVVHFTP